MAQPISRFRFLERLGFDRPKLWQGLQVASAAFVAVACAWALGLSHPQWAAITVFVTLQPTRGQIIEKASYRFIGTLIGCGFGALMAWACAGAIAFELLALCLWSALMVFLGSLQRSYRSYATLLAGYSAIIVIVLDPFNPDMVREVALERITVVVIGLFSAVLWAYLAKLQNADREIFFKARRLTADILHACAHVPREASPARPPNARDRAAVFRMLSAAAHLQDELYTLTAERRPAKARQIEHLLQALTNLLFALEQHPSSGPLAEALAHAAQRLHGQNSFTGLSGDLRRALHHAQDPIVEAALSTMMVAATALEHDTTPIQLQPESRRRYALDWIGATQGALRILVVLGVISLAWIATGDPIFQYPLVSAAICVALATTGAAPRRKMVDVIKGQTAAALVAVSTEMLLWRAFPGPEAQLLALIPATLIFAFLRAHRKMSLSAPDYAITVFCLLSPSFAPYSEDIFPPLKAAMAALSGVLGYLAFVAIFPTDARARRKTLWLMIKRDIHHIASIPRVGISPDSWRLSFAARFLKITHWATLEGGVYEKTSLTMQKGFVTMRMAEVVFLLKNLERRTGLASQVQRACRSCLARIAASNRENEKLSRDINILEQRLISAGLGDEARLITALKLDMADMRALRGL